MEITACDLYICVGFIKEHVDSSSLFYKLILQGISSLRSFPLLKALVSLKMLFVVSRI